MSNMKHRFTTIAAVTLSLALGSAILLRPARAAAEEKCTVAVKGTSPTAKACARGGRAEARKVMKSMVTAAGAKGVKFGCDNCHQDIINYELLKDAVENYKKLQAASGMK
jgi:hypothetical protein